MDIRRIVPNINSDEMEKSRTFYTKITDGYGYGMDNYIRVSIQSDGSD